MNVVNRLPTADRWTHFWAGGNEYRQLDYILLSKDLADASPGPPTVVRNGLPYQAERYAGPRFDEVGQDTPKASDHCPVWAEVGLGRTDRGRPPATKMEDRLHALLSLPRLRLHRVEWCARGGNVTNRTT